jgi:hypothetical protein
MKMIALLMGVISEGLGDDWELAEQGSLSNTPGPLSLERGAYLDLRLKRVT